MKHSLLLILTILSFNLSFGQNSKVVYGSDSRWFLSLGGGAAWHSTDVQTKIKFGFTGELGYSLFMKPGSPISLDIGLRYLTGSYEGQDLDRNSGISENIGLNGIMDPNINYWNYPGYTVMNFRSSVHDLSLELQLNTNRLRERTGWNFFLFGSVGFSFYRSMGNLTYFDIVSQTNQMYDYDSLYTASGQEFTKSSIKNFLDDDFESALEGSSKSKINSKFTPSIGLGFSYQLAPRIAVGAEHRTTFTLNDLFDGNRFNPDNTESTNNDLYHYTGLFVRFHLKGKGKVKDNGNNSLGQIDNFTANPVKPKVDIFDPADNPYTTDFPTFTIKAVVLNVDDKSQVTFKQNGEVNNNFTFDPSTHRFESTVTLNPGQNVFEVRGTNSAGTDAENRIIILESEEDQPPIVNFNNPSYSPFTVNNGTFQMSATILNVKDPNKVKVELNGQNLTNFNFNPTTDILTCPLTLNGGPNTVTVTGTNDVGSDSKSTVIVYEVVQQQLPPIVNFIVPGLNPYTTSNASMNVSATVLNVDSKNDIGVKVNGQVTNDFNWNSTTKTLDLGINLNPGNNVVEVSGTNDAGYDSKSTVIIKNNPEIELPPVVNFIDPNSNPKTVFASNYNLIARVENVQSNNQISLKINGVQTSNFTFVPSSKLMTFSSTLINGANVFEITATNNAGQDSKNTTIIFTEMNTEAPPVVSYSSPSVTPLTVHSNLFNIAGSVLNVDNSNQIQVLVNGNAFSNFSFNPTTKVITFPIALSIGNNVVQITGTNTAGSDTEQTIINYEQLTQGNPPVVAITSPFNSPYNTNVNHHLLKATILEVDFKSQVQVKRNGLVVSPFLYSFNSSTKQLTFNATLSQGNNIFEVAATNQYGSDMKTAMIVYNQVVAPCNKPAISFQNPGTSNFATNISSYSLKAQLLNVANQQYIKLRVNGTLINSFSFNTATKILTKTINLNPGTNVVQLEATNSCGGSSASTFIIYDQPNDPCFPPTIAPIIPNISYFSSQSKYITVKASISHVTNSSNLNLKINGQNVNFTFDNATKMLIGNLTLNTGNNNVEVIASTNCGTATYNWNIYHSSCKNPVITMNNPTLVSTTVTNPSYVISASISEIQNSNNIQFKRNGQNINFIYNSVTKSFNSTVNLTSGQNNFELISQNQCGSDTKSFNITYNPIQQVNPPSVDITSPNVSPYNTASTGMTIKAIIDNVASASQITVIFNGSTISNFNYSPSSGILSFYTSLQNGPNAVNITAVNQAGSDMDQATIIYNPPVTINPPDVVFTNPSSGSKKVAGKSYLVKGYIRNVTSANQVVFQVNSQTITNYQRNFANGRMDFSINLNLSNANSVYNVRVTATNQSGTDYDYRVIQYDLGSNPMGLPGGNGGSNNGGIKTNNNPFNGGGQKKNNNDTNPPNNGGKTNVPIRNNTFKNNNKPGGTKPKTNNPNTPVKSNNSGVKLKK